MAGQDSTTNSGLSPKQMKVIENFTDETNAVTFCNVTESIKAAGYSSNSNPWNVLNASNRLKQAIQDATQDMLLMHGPTAAKQIIDVATGQITLNAGNRLKAAESILDRVGVTKKQHVEVKSDAPSAVVFIPTKTSD
jgi:phage terminase small subunit